jgi:hypothetical protein
VVAFCGIQRAGRRLLRHPAGLGARRHRLGFGQPAGTVSASGSPPGDLG